MHSLSRRTSEEILRATAGISPEQLARHPSGKWSVAQILEHLSLAFAGTAKGTKRLIAGDSLSRPRTLKNRIATVVVVTFGYMPAGRQAPTGTVPGAGDPAHAVNTILDTLTAMDAALTEAESKLARSARLPHPILGPLTISQWRKFHWVHTRHHMKQIARRKLRGNADCSD